MATQKKIIVQERIQKKVKGKPTTTVLKEVKTDGTEAGATQAVENLRKKATKYFEVLDQNKGVKTTYTLTLSGKNYETKVIKV